MIWASLGLLVFILFGAVGFGMLLGSVITLLGIWTEIKRVKKKLKQLQTWHDQKNQLTENS
jgi:uncharacterized membrane protein